MMEARETNGPRRTQIEPFMHNEYMPFINSLVRVRSNCSGSVGLGGALFLSHTVVTVPQLVSRTVRGCQRCVSALKRVDYDTV